MASSKWFRIIPVALIMYMLAYMDRINVGVLTPFMQKDLHLSAAASGNIAGIFFIGYMIMQIPGGILASRWSARKLIFILMLFWGVFATLCGFVHTEGQLIFVRFLLGIAEGGVWTGTLVLLANWFTTKERASANGFWMACLPISAILMAPLSGILLKHFNWHQVLMLEGFPPIIWAFVWLFTMKDKPSQGTWMKAAEREKLIKDLELEQKSEVKSDGYSVAFKNKTVWGLVVAYFFYMTGYYGYTLWVPSVVKSFTNDPATMGWLTAIPFTFALIGMLYNSYLSDKRQDRVSAVVVPLIIAAVAMTLGQFVNSPVLKMILLTITAIGAFAPYGPFWAIPTAVIPATVVGAAMGLTNAIGNIGGYFGPTFFGAFKDLTGNYHVGFYFLAICLIISAIVTALVGRSIKGSTPKAVTTNVIAE